MTTYKDVFTFFNRAFNKNYKLPPPESVPKPYLEHVDKSKNHALVNSEMSDGDRNSLGMLIDFANDFFNESVTLEAVKTLHSHYPFEWHVAMEHIIILYKKSTFTPEAVVQVCQHIRDPFFLVLEMQLKMYCVGLPFCEMILPHRHQRVRVDFGILFLALALIYSVKNNTKDCAAIVERLRKCVVEYIDIHKIKLM